MDPSYSWHPGTVRVASCWAVPVDLLPDELFSSWLARVALANGCDPLVFTGEIWPRWRVWTGDVDRQPPIERLAVLEKMSGIPIGSFAAATLAPIARRVLGVALPKNNTWPWILPVGARNRRRHGGLQYCPRCLDEDRSPYYRLQWRFAWHVVCTRHGCMLLDRCPHCDASLEPHRATAEARTIRLCASCRHALDDAPARRIESGCFLGVQEETDSVLKSGTGQVLGQTVSVETWFAVLRFWLDLVRRALQAKTVGMANLVDRMPSVTGGLPDPVIFEGLQTAQRLAVLDRVGWLLSLSFEELIDLMRTADVSRQNLVENGVPPIVAVHRLADALPSRKGPTRVEGRGQGRPVNPPPPRSRRRVEWMMKKLRQKAAARS